MSAKHFLSIASKISSGLVVGMDFLFRWGELI